MHAHLAEEVSLEDLAKVAYVSRFHLIRMFKQTYGETPYQRLTRLRLQRAQRLLATSDTPITRIALDCGFTNQTHFAAAFRRLVGLSPGLTARASRADFGHCAKRRQQFSDTPWQSLKSERGCASVAFAETTHMAAVGG
jgi:AraC family transcriptional regulator